MANALLKDYDGDYLLCRNVGHHWDVVGYFRAADGLVCRDLVCSRCGTDRRDRWLRSSGERVGSFYRYAHGYKVETDTPEERPNATDVRSEVIRRAKIYANEEQMFAAIINGRS
jgi:hypothetical protein